MARILLRHSASSRSCSDGYRFPADHRGRAASHLDLVGAIIVTLAMAHLAYLPMVGSTAGWRSTPTVRGALLAAFLVGAFLLQIGSALGVTALMAVATAVTSSHSVPGEGSRAALAVACGLAAVAFVVSAAFVGTRRAGEPSLTLPAGRRHLRRCAAGTPS